MIVFDRSLFSTAQTITLNLGELDITHSLDIIAPRDSVTGGDLVTVSGKGASRVFEIEKGATANLDGLIVVDGLVTTDDGGGIENSGTLTLENTIVRNDSANSNGSNAPSSINGYGGGIYNTGNLKIDNSTISDNLATANGGSIYNSGTTAIHNSTISSSLAKGSGGGIFNTGNLKIDDSAISDNSSEEGGSGILNELGTVKISNSTITDNSGDSSGGGIYNTGMNSILTVSNSIISNNTAGLRTSSFSNGGGILNNLGTVKISNSTITDNSAINDGGGIVNNNGTVEISNSTLSGNLASNDGGGIENSGNLASINSTLSNNSASQAGGGIYNIGIGSEKVTLVFSTLTGNQAANGGGILNVPGNGGMIPPSSATVRNTIIAANLNSAGGVNPDVSGTFTSNGYNLIGDSTGSTGFGVTGDIVGTSDNPIDPLLAPLAFNGGRTQTVALLPGSPAIGAADPIVLSTDPTTDQRGLPRRAADGSADIGAYELS